MTEEDARAVLGVGPDATESEIKRAAAKCFREVHSDSNPYSGLSSDEIKRRINEIQAARAILLGHTPPSQPPESEPPAEPRPSAEPSMVDFGTVQEGDEPNPVAIDIRCNGTEPYEVKGVVPPFGAWWEFDDVNTRVATDDERREGLLAKLAFVVPIAPRLKPETYEGDQQVTVADIVVNLPIRLKVAAASKRATSTWRTTDPPKHTPPRTPRPPGRTHHRPPSDPTGSVARRGPLPSAPPPARDTLDSFFEFLWIIRGAGIGLLGGVAAGFGVGLALTFVIIIAGWSPDVSYSEDWFNKFTSRTAVVLMIVGGIGGAIAGWRNSR